MITVSMVSPPPNPLLTISPSLLISPPSGTQRLLLSTSHRASKVTHIVTAPPDLAGVSGLILTKSGVSPDGSITLLDETEYTKKYLEVSRPYSYRPQFTMTIEGASDPVTIPLHQPASCTLTIIPLSDSARPTKKQKIAAAPSAFEIVSKLIRIEGSTPGTFDRKAALALGVPVGPLFGKLVKGETIVTPAGDEVKPSQCMGEPAVWRVGIVFVLSSEDFERLPKDVTYDFVYFQSTSEVLDSSSFKDWWSGLKRGSKKGHFIKYDASKPKGTYISNSSAKLIYKLSLISPRHFRVPNCVANCFEEVDYQLTPVNKKGLVKSKSTDIIPNMYGLSVEDKAEVEEDLAKRGFEEAAQAQVMKNDTNPNKQPEIVFLGTGSSIPSKHRNVTSTYINYGRNSLLLDCGENSITQLKCMFSNVEDYVASLLSIKLVWISHPHADHLLGINEFILERRRVGGHNKEKVYIIAPETVLPSVKFFLGEEEGGEGVVVMLDCREFLDGIPDGGLAEELGEVGVTKFQSLYVDHCRNSYGVVLTCEHWGTIAFSGDCRPSRKFLNFKADILIHEATFEDDLEDEAIVKKHSTIGEAVGIGKGMECKYIVLSHFSQRYPGFPRGVPKYDNVIVAWDWMRLTWETMQSATGLGGVMELMFEDEDKKEGEGNDRILEGEDEIGGVKVSEIMKEPGGFAVKGVIDGGCGGVE
ncbi:hypothetical protein TrLO_g15973 [Triparma laevis f. longispina]|uniref:ribonuclease Z n=1 Tax=Triparma laevis f. longispina TaxID=1714387 RepID=A0A9W7FB13_9STRA|nr:hypothetical protein TrLO_g15973 [Triparma laevis f. longispina]